MTDLDKGTQMRNRAMQLIKFLVLPVIFLIDLIRGRQAKNIRVAARTPIRRMNAGFLSSLAGQFVRLISGNNSRDVSFDTGSQSGETTEDMAAKAIADTLVTRTPFKPGDLQKPRRRSVRISKLHSEEEYRTTVKSPTSAALSPDIARKAKLRASALGRPLIPHGPSRKTLILDLDETLIHSLSNGGKLSNSHMIEVKLGIHAILYYVYKRPHCDVFLEKVSQWYDVVIFTASVQEYADPIIDWLEQDRKYFKARYYRQHCTFRSGAYMKDLSIAEPNLSRAIIVDNSPLSYRMNEQNAIPIEGWISDPTDRDLLHLIPVLQNLHLVSDVRSLLSLRQPD